jgi:alkylhydroperoxidase/carboxymuconolactone decarboxylase family protein YurZ
MNQKNPMVLLQEEAPKAAQAFYALLESVYSGSGLDEKTGQLIYIGIRASQGDHSAVTAHVPMAKKAGVTRQELKETIVLTLGICGVTGVVHCLAPALDAYDNC